MLHCFPLSIVDGHILTLIDNLLVLLDVYVALR